MEAKEASSEKAFNEAEYLDVIQFGNTSGLESVVHLREHLQDTKRWTEAVLLHGSEDDLYALRSDFHAKKAALESLTTSLEYADEFVPLTFMRAAKVAALANTYDELNQNTKATALISKAKDIILLNTKASRSYREDFLDLTEMKISSPTLQEMNLDQLLEFADRHHVTRFRMAEGVALGMAGLVLLAAHIWNGFSISTRERAVRERTEKLYEEIGHVKNLLVSGIAYHSPLLSDDDECSAWRSSFDKAHPGYSAWKQLISLSLQIQSRHIHGEAFVAALVAKQRAEQLNQDCLFFWNGNLEPKEMPKNSRLEHFEGHAKAAMNETLKSHMFPRFFFEDYNFDMTIADPNTGTHYFGSLGSNSVTTLRPAPFTRLLSWLLIDLREGVLLPSDISAMLSQEAELGVVQEYETFLSSSNPQDIADEIYGKMGYHISYERWGTIFEMFRKWLHRTESFPYTQRSFMLIELLKGRMERRLPHDLLVEECRRNLSLLPELVDQKSFKGSGNPLPLFRFQCQIAFTQAAHANWYRKQWTPEMELVFDEAMVMLKHALVDEQTAEEDLYTSTESRSLVRGNLYYELGALLAGKLECHVPIDLSEALDHLWRAETCFRMKRETFKSTRGFQRVVNLLRALEQPMVRNIFPLALRVQSSFPLDLMPDILKVSAWSWIQHAKTRGLTTLGWFSELNKKYSEMSPLMTAEPDIQNGFGLLQLKTLAAAADQRVLFIDWYTDFFWGAVGSPVMVVYMPGMAQPELFRLDDQEVDISNLKTHKDRFFSALQRESTRDEQDGRPRPEFWLQKFEPLVRPILDLSKKGDILVLSPCGLLHGIPLHAVLLDGEPLISRNPVSYTTSMRSLWYASLSRVSLMPPSKLPMQDLYSHVFCGAPTSAGQEAAQKVSEILVCDTPSTNVQFSKKVFLSALESPLYLLHYHGHATSQPDDPLEQSLNFHDCPLSVQEYLDLIPVSKGHHITLLGCSSGVTVNTSSNEPLGLVPALMHHGAASTISALWPIDDKHAAAYSDAFYDSFRPIEDKLSSTRTHQNEPAANSEPSNTAFHSPDQAQSQNRLPSGWESRLISNGKTYFIDHNTRTTTYNDPRLPSPPQSADSPTRLINLAIANQKAVLHLMNSSHHSSFPLQSDVTRDTRFATTEKQSKDVGGPRTPLRNWAGYVLNGWWIMRAPVKRGMVEDCEGDFGSLRIM